MLDTVKALCALSGVSGWEDEVRDYILEQALPYADETATDPMGNLYIFKKGAVSPAEPVMVCAHMDEVGLIVTGVDEEGYLRFDFVGGVDRRVVLGKRVFIGPEAIPGVIGMKAIHLTDEDERQSVPTTESLRVDIGAEDAGEAKGRVRPGDRGVFDNTVYEFGSGFVKAKALDDRVGCAAMLTLLRDELPVDTWFVFTVQEEVGCRGAAVAADRIKPGFALVLEGTTAADLAGVEKGQEVCFLGRGVVIPFMDRGTIYDHELHSRFTALAEKNGIPWQTKEKIAGGTDASAIQRRGSGAQVLTVSVPLRSIHSSASVGKLSDIELMPAFAMKVLEELSGGY